MDWRVIALGVIVFGFIFWKHSTIFRYEDHTRLLISEIKDLLSTGDLILFSGATPVERAIKFHTGSPYSHIALVVKDEEGEVWLWEADVGRGGKDGPRVLKLEDKLYRWKGDPQIRIVTSSKVFDIDPHRLAKFISSHLFDEMDDAMDSWLWGYRIEERRSTGANTKRIWFCSELVVRTLKETTNVGKVIFTKDAAWYSPQKALDIITSTGGIVKNMGVIPILE